MHEPIRRAKMARRSLAWLAASVLAVTAGCGDDSICPSETMVFIATPAAGAVLEYDGGNAVPGALSDVVVRSNLAPGDVITLSVSGSGGTSQYEMAVDADGTAMFPALLLPPGGVSLRATGASAECGSASDEIQVDVVSTTGCALAVRGMPPVNEFYQMPVLNTAIDADASLPEFQGSVDFSAAPGTAVELLVLDLAQGSETSAGTVTVDDTGAASLAVTLGQGRQALRAICTRTTGNDGSQSTTPTTTVYVDTEAPACSLVSPSERTSIVPQMDADGDAANGTQIAFTGQTDVELSDDVAGELGTVSVNGSSFEGTPVDAQGESVVTATFDLAGSFAVTFSTQDHAGNACTASRTYSYVTEGCSLVLQGPLDIINSDANGDPVDGLQGDLLVQVDPVCAGETVSTDCGTGTTTATVAPDGLTTVRATLCDDAVCAASYQCTIRVLRETGIETFLGVDLAVDTEPPGAVDGLVVTTPDRQSLALAWTAPADAGNTAAARYLIKMATEPLDESNFDSTGVEIGGPVPAIPGTLEGMRIEALRPGTSYYIGVAAVDAVGNRSFAASQGPFVPDIAHSGSIGAVSPEDGNNGLGYQLAPGDFDGDGFGDLAVAAPYKGVNGQIGVGTVYVYFGSPTGMSAQPDVTIEGTEANGQLGNGITAIQWGGDLADDLAVGAPYVDGASGRIFIFHGGPDFASVTGEADADVVIGAAGGWFAGSALGWSLTRARFDDDDKDDLVTGAVGGGGGNGGLVVIHGGATATSILLSDEDSSGSGDARVTIVEDPDQDQATTIFDLFGQFVFNLGRTQGSDDSNDDIGVAYFEKKTAAVIRGRAQPEAPGVVRVPFDEAVDLQLVNDSPDTVVRFGASMASIADMNGDGAREIVVSGWREGANLGRVFIVDGDQVGTHDTRNIDLGLLLPGVGMDGLGSAIVNNATSLAGGDLDNDGLEDLMVVAGLGEGNLAMYVWFGGAIPTGTFTTDSAQHVIPAPVGFSANAIANSDTTPIVAAWVGDINNDGLEDLAWADHIASVRDGLWELLSDDIASVDPGGDPGSTPGILPLGARPGRN